MRRRSRRDDHGDWTAATLRAYSRPAVVAHYDREVGLFASEQAVYDKHLRPGMSIVDLGVGTGRTTPYLSRFAARYVGVDLARPMVQRCREKYPGREFLEMDATDLRDFGSESTDVVVFSFNGLDTLLSVEARARCLAEVTRILRPGGMFFFSSHNARHLLFRPVVTACRPAKAVWRVLYALFHTCALLVSRIPSPAFWRGHGFVLDLLAQGGTWVYTSTPPKVHAELARHGFCGLDAVPGPVPSSRLGISTPWYEYVFRKGAIG